MTEVLPPKPSWLSEPSPVERLRHCWVVADEALLAWAPLLVFHVEHGPHHTALPPGRSLPPLQQQRRHPALWLPAEQLEPA